MTEDYNKNNNIKMKAKDLNLFYGDKQALFDINIDIEEKKVTSLIGPSGCGKSSFLRCLNRMNDTIPNCKIDGKILLDNKNIYSKSINLMSLRTKVGMVFQKPNPFPKSIYENIVYGPKLHGLVNNKESMAQIVEETLKMTGLFEDVKDRLHLSALSLSGGQQQRLCIARALAVKPDVILMDEPCSALDPKATAKIESLIDQMSEEYTIIIVTHSMQQAARISDNTAFFMNGKLLEFGKTEQIFTNPKESETEDYITGRFG